MPSVLKPPYGKKYSAAPLIPFIDLHRQYRSLKKEIAEAISEVMASCHFIRGSAHNAFAKKFARYCEAAGCAPLANGTDALYLALRALDIGPGDEVITTPLTFIATVEMINRVGAKPVLVDVDPDSWNLDPQKIEKALTPKTRALIPVHLFGFPADMDPLLQIARQRGLKIIEDACQAHGARYKGKRVGSLGDAAAFSFYPSKNLGAFGDGGACTSNSTAVIERILRLGNHGCQVQYQHLEEGINSRLDELQAAILRVKLKYLDSWNESRRRLAAQYQKELSGIGALEFQKALPQTEPVYHLFVIQTARRDELQAYLRENGVLTQIHYPKPLHLYDCYRSWNLRPGSFPVAERIASRALSLPLFPELKSSEVSRVCALIRRFFR